MISYMDLVQQCFYLSTDWRWDNTYERILETPRNLLQFPIPNGVKITVSSRNTENNYSSINISQVDRLEGSLSYLTSSANLDEYYQSSRTLPISRVLHGYREILSQLSSPGDSKRSSKPFLLYGKMYFPSQFLEGMLIKRFSPNYQLIVKFVNTPKLNKLTQPTSIFTFYLQRQTENCAHDFIYSTREDLFGFRCLYHLDFLASNSQINPMKKSDLTTPKPKSKSIQHPSKLSAGCELWYAAGNVSPGMSVAARYTTLLHSLPYAISSIHPLTFTIAANPLLGTFESTYAIKSDALFKVLSSKYQFNMYSYDSDLIFGAQILRSKLTFKNKNEPVQRIEETPEKTLQKYSSSTKPFHPYQLDQQHIIHKLSHISQHNIVYKVSDEEGVENTSEAARPGQSTKSHQNPPLTSFSNDMKIVEQEEKEEYISSLKVSGSITKQNLRVAWEGKFYEWFVSSGASIDMKGIGSGPRVLKYGIEFAYNS
ncbi:hypothetical protein PICMEDRAFT_36935 [Pichia membranifaciens NRRL Y-2026]|uniref:Mitochondrial distribution and morphology protein 10 n=1 Tax=Pichia membranifaciens NRRL Y-2026 TaxID=763406 RepID=A0A1E3NEV6_9ASCO|nr:hypothetical protein PICMEDRAFT_36935 [Pichia membranifaciens NRRL Y-2026]ODQ44685.1 hypothetical protein PICMEDRAFT_36935 [Pichia membranifaciens NRRL Y-2026]